MSDGTARVPLIPDHEVLRVIGRGSYGVIWLARTLTGRLRAVKVIDRAAFESERSFQREFDGMSSFEPISRRHGGFVNILHVGRGDGFFYYIMELADDEVRGQDIEIESYKPRTIKSELDSRGRLPPAECIEIGISLTDALETLHGHSLIHRDIKPANIIFVRGVPKLADIGLVAASGQYSFVGTEGYVPPEGPGTAQADIFSLGKVFYEITMGKDRLDFPEMATRIDEISEKDHVHGLNEILLKACAAKPSKRYHTAAEMHADLLRLRSGLKPARPFVRVAAIVAFVAVALGTWLFLRPPAPAPVPHVFATPTPMPQLPTPMPTPAIGSLTVTTSPAGGKVRVMRGTILIRDGVAPFTLQSLPAGDYTISGKFDLATASMRTTVAAGKTAAAELQFPTGNGTVKITSAPGGATVFENNMELGRTTWVDDDVAPGTHRYRIHLDGYKDAEIELVVHPEEPLVRFVSLEHSLGPEPGKPWTNSLGMKFVPVSDVRFCIWETRVKDYAEFCAETARAAGTPEFPQGDDHPVVLVDWQDAMDFCEWLTAKEHREGRLNDRQHYRLPTDREWSEAVGLPAENGTTPESRDGFFHKIYPWGKTWPPPKGAGNYADQALKKDFIAGYNDGFAQTSPAGSFPALANGVHDLGGNVWEWVLDGYKGGTDAHDNWAVVRGGSYANKKRIELESSYRNVVSRSERDVIYGFRCVLDDGYADGITNKP
ncbi:MAG: SUMF1/EgtB/PvdO family nonheme iron enzyme [Chthoniobacterales bacterium]